MHPWHACLTLKRLQKSYGKNVQQAFKIKQTNGILISEFCNSKASFYIWLTDFCSLFMTIRFFILPQYATQVQGSKYGVWFNFLPGRIIHCLTAMANWRDWQYWHSLSIWFPHVLVVRSTFVSKNWFKNRTNKWSHRMMWKSLPQLLGAVVAAPEAFCDFVRYRTKTHVVKVKRLHSPI